MFVKRKRTQKGPPQKQIYVPRDQRALEPPTIPIQTEKQAQYYYNQLKYMGYFQQQIINDINVFTIVTETDVQFKFTLNNDQTLTWQGAFPETIKVYDMKGSLIQNQYLDLIRKKINQDGYKLLSLRIKNNLKVYNHSDSEAVTIKKLTNAGSLENLTVPMNTNLTFNTIDEAVTAKSGTTIHILDSDTGTEYQSSTSEYFWLDNVPLYIKCNEISVLAIKT